MLTQTSVKVSLAWSTTAQMGFMLLECGLGLYSLAMLHLVAHSLYKAHAFLASGSVVDNFRAPEIHYSASNAQAGRRAWATGIAILMTLGIGAASGVMLSQQPALIAAGSIVAIAITQLLLQATDIENRASFLLRALALSAIVSTAYFALHHLFELALMGSVFPVTDTGGVFETVIAVLIIAVFIGLLLLQHALKKGRMPLHDEIYTHLYNGLYIDVFITRILQRVWPAPAHAAKS
jgi:NAD(P)H-quinone oxidoreductase subunit 5